MSALNSTGRENGTSFVSVNTETAGFTFFQALFLSVCVVSSLILLSTLVYYVLRKRALNELRHRLVPQYHFDATDADDWEDAVLDDSKLASPRRSAQYYRSMSSP